MTIAYNLGIPASADNPSTDQPNMQTNNDNIATYVAVDHVAFNSAGSGEHEQVTFNSNNVPASPTTPPVLFTNLVNSIAQLFFYSGSAAQSANQYVSAASGSTFALGGIIVKWGTSAVIGSVSFPVAFPNNCYAVVITGTSTLYTGGFVVSAVAAANFTVARTSGAGSTGYYYIAIGN